MMDPVLDLELATHVQMVGAAEGVFLARTEAETLAQSCHGDVRKAMNTLQFLLSTPTTQLTQLTPLPSLTSSIKTHLTAPGTTASFHHDDALREDHQHLLECYRDRLRRDIQATHSDSSTTTIPAQRQLSALRRWTRDCSLADTLVGRKRPHFRCLPSASLALDAAGTVTRRPFSLKHAHLTNALDEEAEGQRLDFPTQTGLEAFSRELTDALSVGMIDRYQREISGSDGDTSLSATQPLLSSLATHLLPPEAATVASTHLVATKRLRGLSVRFPLETAMPTGEGLILDYAPFLKHVVCAEDRRAAECAKRRFTHYFKSIDFLLDDQWMEGDNEKYVRERFSDTLSRKK